MFCYQCEQALSGKGCVKVGVCGKDHETASLQDLLLYVAKGVSMYANRLRKMGVIDRPIDVAVTEYLFTTVTNVNFDADKLADLVKAAADMREKARKLYEGVCAKNGKTPETLAGPASVKIAAAKPKWSNRAKTYPSKKEKLNSATI